MNGPDPETRIVREELEDGRVSEKWYEDAEGNVLAYKDWREKGELGYRRVLDRDGNILESEVLVRKSGRKKDISIDSQIYF